MCIFFISHFHIVLFLGEEKVRSVPWKLTKQDVLLKKTVVPKRPAVDRKSGAGGSKAGPGGNRSRSPGSYNRNYGGGKGNQHNKRGSRGKSGGSAPRRAKVADESDEETAPKDKRKSSGNSKGKKECDTDLVQDKNVKKTSETNSGILQNDGILRANDVETKTNQQDRNSIGRLLCHHAKVSANIIKDFKNPIELDGWLELSEDEDDTANSTNIEIIHKKEDTTSRKYETEVLIQGNSSKNLETTVDQADNPVERSEPEDLQEGQPYGREHQKKFSQLGE